MTVEHLKQAHPPQQAIDTATGETVRRMLDDIRAGGEDAVRRYARDLDGYTGEIVLGEAAFAQAERDLAPGIKDDIRFARDRVQDFAQRQRDSMHEFRAELLPGLVAGQRLIPCSSAGCYVPGGRYAHAASAIMSVGTAQVAGVSHIVATSPATKDHGVHPGILYAMKLCGAHTVLALGGVQAVAALAYGLFSGHEAVEWIAAFRFMREGLIQTLLIVAGVSLGVSVIVFMSALLSGLQANIVRRTLNYQAPIVVVPPDQVARPLRSAEAARVQPRSQRLRSIDQWQKVRDEIGRVADVTAATPVASGPGFALRGDASKAVTLIGIEPETYFQVIALAEKIVAGKASAGSTDAIIGIELAKDLGAGLGDKLRLATASGAGSTLTVAGIFDFGNKGANERNVYIAFRVAQNLLDLVGGASSIEARVRDPFEAERIAQTIQARTGQQADSWIKTNAQFFTAMAAQSLSNTLIRFFVGLTAALGIASVLVVSVVQKSREIGILRAMGAARAQILRLFLIQGGAMGLAGSLFGSLMGWGFLIVWRRLAINPDGTPMFIVDIEPSLFAMAAAGATLVGVLAAAAPARRAARLDPVVAIRG